jgi:transposase
MTPIPFTYCKPLPGIGKILSLVILYEVYDINRFPRVQEFLSYARLVKPRKESNGKITGRSNGKIGNAHLKWAFSEAAVLLMRESEKAKRFIQSDGSQTRQRKSHLHLRRTDRQNDLFYVKERKGVRYGKIF